MSFQRDWRIDNRYHGLAYQPGSESYNANKYAPKDYGPGQYAPKQSGPKQSEFQKYGFSQSYGPAQHSSQQYGPGHSGSGQSGSLQSGSGNYLDSHHYVSGQYESYQYGNNTYMCNPIPSAYAYIYGGPSAPNIKGVVYFIDALYGSFVKAQIYGLPTYRPSVGSTAPIGPHGFHIHENGNCTVGDPEDPFQAAGGHYSPQNQPHGNHAGDFPVLFSNNGQALMTFYTNRFRPCDVIGKSIIIHQNPDDYRTQPAGNAGKRLACGLIVPYTA